MNIKKFNELGKLNESNSENIKIFDENGNKLNINDVIYDFIEKKSKGLNIDSDEICLGINDHSNTLDVIRLTENSYDSTDIQHIEEIKTTKPKSK